MSQLPLPPIPADADLRTWPFMMVDTERVLGSEFVRQTASCPAAFRAGWILLCKAWHQLPAGSLPDDDMDLAYFVRLPMQDWMAIRDIALRGFVKCRDGRLYHPVLTVRVLEAWRMRQMQREKRAGRTKAGQEPPAPPPIQSPTQGSTADSTGVPAADSAADSTGVPADDSTTDSTAVPTAAATADSTAVQPQFNRSYLPPDNQELTDSSGQQTAPVVESTADSTAVQPQFNRSSDKGSEGKGSEGKGNEVNLAPEAHNQNGIVGAEQSHDNQSLFEDEQTRQQREKPASSKASKTPIPEGFELAPSPAVSEWAEKHGHQQLKRHLDHFCTVARNRNYQYVDWDRALMTAIRDDWAGIGKLAKEIQESPDGHSGFEGVDYLMGQTRNTMSMAEAARLSRSRRQRQAGGG
jgi:hypothetical protein